MQRAEQQLDGHLGIMRTTAQISFQTGFFERYNGNFVKETNLRTKPVFVYFLQFYSFTKMRKQQKKLFQPVNGMRNTFEINKKQIQHPLYLCHPNFGNKYFCYFFVGLVCFCFLWAAVAAWYRMTIHPPPPPNPRP